MTGPFARALQESRPIGAAAASMLDRSNISTTHTFKVLKEHATAAAAEDYILTHPVAALAATGAITAQSEPGGTVRTLSGALLETAELIEHSGASTIWAYRIRGGVFS
jgi:hypothetical protein